MQGGDTCQVKGKVELISGMAQLKEMKHKTLQVTTDILGPESHAKIIIKPSLIDLIFMKMLKYLWIYIYAVVLCNSVWQVFCPRVNLTMAGAHERY